MRNVEEFGAGGLFCIGKLGFGVQGLGFGAAVRTMWKWRHDTPKVSGGGGGGRHVTRSA